MLHIRGRKIVFQQYRPKADIATAKQNVRFASSLLVGDGGAHGALFHALGDRHVLARRAQPGVPLDRDPVRIVERAARERAQARQELRGMRDDRPAIRAELQADPAPRFVGAMLVRLEVLGALDARVALVEPGRHDKRAPRAALAELAMTGDRADRLAGRRVADGTAEAAAGVDVIIHLASSSGPGSYLLLVLRPSSVF